MAGPASFNIDYTCSPNALMGILEYRFYQPDGTWSSWQQNSTLGVFTINTSLGLNQSLTNVIGNGLDFNYNTTYQFRIQQFCDTGDTIYSDISDYVVDQQCPEYTVGIGLYENSSYQLNVNIYDSAGMGSLMSPLNCSIVSYSIEVYTIINNINTLLGTINVPYTDIIAGSSSHLVIITSDDLIQPIDINTQYEIVLKYSIINPDTVDLYSCSSKFITSPSCATYKVYTAEYWVIEWVDCNGVIRKCGNPFPKPFPYAGGDENTFYICSKVVPKGYSCYPLPGGGYNRIPPAYTSPSGIINISNPAAPGSWDPAGLVWGAVIEKFDENGCDSAYNGDLQDTYSGQIPCVSLNC